MSLSGSVVPEDPNWPYVDSPWDLLRDCQVHVSGSGNLSDPLGACILSHMLGIVSAYIFPFVGLFGVVSNILVTYVFLFVFRKPSRQMIYLGCVAAADFSTIVLFGWIWMFPAKGLPYASGARVYFFIFNINDFSCKTFRFLYSFTSCFSSTLFLVTATDRCLCIYFPLKFSRVSRRRAWEAVAATALLSFFAMLPFGIVVVHRESQGKIICWAHDAVTFVQIYHVLLANSSLVQTVLVIFINIALLIRLRQSATLRESMSKCTSANREIASSMLLVIMSAIVVICALPQSIAYIFSTILANVAEGEAGRASVRMAYNVSDLGWQLLFLQQACNWILYMKRMKNFRLANLKLLRCRCNFGRGLIDETFGSVHYLTTKARIFTSDTRFHRGGISKAESVQFGNRRTKGGVSDFWNLKYSNGVIPGGGGASGVNDASEVCRYTYRGSMRQTTTVSTISPCTVYQDQQKDAAAEATKATGNTRTVTRF